MIKEDRIKLFIVSHDKYFPQEVTLYLKTILSSLDDNQLLIIESTRFHNPQLVFMVSYFIGFLGIDRFMIKNTVLGLFKLLTLGGFFIWYIIDCFFILRATRRANLKLFNEVYEKIGGLQKS